MLEEQVKQIVSDKKRDLLLEMALMEEFASKFEGVISRKEIMDTLLQNCANGIHFLNEKKYEEIFNDDEAHAIYLQDYKAIFINQSVYQDMPQVVMHELGHALLGSKNIKEIYLDNKKIEYGKGLEEGAVSILASTENINNMNVKHVESYFGQVRIILQLNELYKRTINEYPNILIHIFKSNDKFSELVRKIYEDVIDDQELVLRSALSVISNSDMLVDMNYVDLVNCADIQEALEAINSVYLAIVDKDFREGNSNKMFVYNKRLKYTAEERIFSAVFEDEIKEVYGNRMKKILDSLVQYANTQTEYIDKSLIKK